MSVSKFPSVEPGEVTGTSFQIARGTPTKQSLGGHPQNGILNDAASTECCGWVAPIPGQSQEVTGVRSTAFRRPVVVVFRLKPVLQTVKDLSACSVRGRSFATLRMTGKTRTWERRSFRLAKPSEWGTVWPKTRPTPAHRLAKPQSLATRNSQLATLFTRNSFLSLLQQFPQDRLQKNRSGDTHKSVRHGI